MFIYVCIYIYCSMHGCQPRHGCCGTGKPTMCLHTGMTDAYVWDLDTPQQRVAGSAETRQILGEIDQVFRREIGHLVYSHKVR